MTKHEAALLLERMVDEGKDLTPGAVEALMMGVNALKGYKPEEWCFGCKEFDKEAHSCPRFNQTIRKAVEALKNDQWIPCEKRSPEESGTYDVTAYDGATRRVTYAKYQKRLKRWELTGTRAYWRVLAWMPMPDPYQPEPEEHTGCTEDACPIEGVEQDER